MKKSILIIIAILATLTSSLAQKRGGVNSLAELDSLVVEKYNSHSSKLQSIVTAYNSETDSVKRIAIEQQYNKLESTINADLLAVYAKNIKIEGVSERIFALRTTISKGELEKIYKRFATEIKENDPYAKGIRSHIDTHQVQLGDTLGNFRAFTSTGHPFAYNEFKNEKEILLIFGSLGALPVEARLILQVAYRDLDISKLEIVSVFTDETDKTEFETTAKNSGIEWLRVCDFRGDHSPLKIAFGVATTPMCFYISRGGAVEYISIGITDEIINIIKANSYKK